MLLLVLFGFALAAADTPPDASYFITYGRHIQQGMMFNIHVEILNTTAPVNIQATINRVWNNYTNTYKYPLVTTSGLASKDNPGKLSLMVPKDISATYRNELHILGSQGLNFEREVGLSLFTQSISIMVQTDKAIYKPGQLVRFRALGVYSNLKLHYGKYDVSLQDPNGNTLKQWTGVQSTTGVIEGEFQLADKSVMGDWIIHVQSESEGFTKRKTFTVSQYQLPRFKVSVELAPFALTSDKLLSGTVKTEYTFGQPVKGMVELHVYTDLGMGSCGQEPKYVELAFPTNGSTKFEMPVSDLYRLSSYLHDRPVKVKAIVKEELTGTELSGSSLITFYEHPYTIEIMPSSPQVFSPKLPYTAFVKVAQQDGRPVTDMSSPVRVYSCVTYRIVQDNQAEYGCSSFTGKYGLPSKNYTIPPSGILPIHMDIPENATDLEVKVHYKDIYDTKMISQRTSISHSFIQLRLMDKEIKAGTDATFSVKHTEDIKHFTYEVTARGLIIHSEFVTVSDPQSDVTFRVPVTTLMSPVSRVLVYYIRDTGEVVSDSQSISVDDVFENKVSINFLKNESEPHTHVDLQVTADPDSNVHLLAVDQSVLLLKTGNDITKDQVLDAMKYYKTGSMEGEFSPDVIAITSSATQSDDLFTKAGVSVLTDAWYYDHLNPPNYYYGPTPYPIGYIPHPGATPYAGPTPYPIGFTPYPGATPYPGLLGGGAHQIKKEVDHVRTDFPEAWLWANYSTGTDGKVTINTTVPDTITSWVASAFAVNNNTGLGVAPTTAKLKVFRSFFVSVSMPTSVLRGEQVVIQASVFNYLNSDVAVTVSLPQSSDYTNILVDNSGQTSQESKDQFKSLTVKTKEQGTVYFPVIPTTLGAIDIEVSARSTLAADAVRKQIIVEAEGLPKEYNIPAFIELTPGGADYRQTFNITLPPQVVSGSQRAKVKVTGDLIGASLDSLENLLALPTGCGEQNMMSFAPDVYVADYLTTTHQMTPALEAKIYDYLQLGFQRELTFQRNDGSFSPFGNSDEAGSMWLTAFVTLTFHQAKPYIFVDNSTLTRALKWMASRQNLDGSFNEPGLVINRQLKETGPALTSIVLLAFLENSDMSGYGIYDYVYGNTTQKAQAYLETELRKTTDHDSYTLAIGSYALAKANSQVALDVYTALDKVAHNKGHLKFWREAMPNSPNYYTTWTPPTLRAQPIDIQTTAYALLASSARGDIKGGQPIVNWLTAQRNPHGGFSSTQDTMVALRALTDYAQHTHRSGFHVDVDVQTDGGSQHVAVSDKNALVLQTRDLTPFPKEVTFTATGKGVAYAEVDTFFNVEAEIGEPAFDINAIFLDDTIDTFRIMICTKWLGTGSTGMAVMEVSIPTGFEPDVTSLSNVAGIKTTERRGRNLVIYFDEIGTTSICFDYLNTRTAMVTNNQQSYITVYDYYQPDNQASIFYETRSLKASTICDVCDKCCPQKP